MFLHLFDILLVPCIDYLARFIIEFDRLLLSFNSNQLSFIRAQICYFFKQNLASLSSYHGCSTIVHQLVLSLLIQMIDMIMRYLLANHRRERFFEIIV